MQEESNNKISNKFGHIDVEVRKSNLKISLINAGNICVMTKSDHIVLILTKNTIQPHILNWLKKVDNKATNIVKE